MNRSTNQFVPAFLNDVPVAIYSCDRSGYITAYNTAAIELWGSEPAIGKELWCGPWKIFRPDGSPLPPEECPMAITLRTQVAVKGEEIVVERSDGTRRIILPHPVPVFDDAGVLTGAINTLIDITEQKQGEIKQAVLAAIVESSEDAILSKTLDGVITSWNHAAEKMFGYTEKEAVGKHITMLIPKDRLAEEDLIISKVRAGELVDHFETTRVCKDGRMIPLSLTVSAVKDHKGRIIGASKVARDITEKRTAEATLKKQVNNLEILNSIGLTISRDLDTRGILQKVTDATTQLTGAQFGAFFYNAMDESGESFMLYTLSGAPREAFEKFGMPRNTEVFHTTFSGQGISRSDDITKDPRYGKNAPHHGMPKGHLPVVSYLAVPVISQSGDVIGGLFFGHSEPAKFTAEHEQLIGGVSSQAAIALDNAKLLNEIQELNTKKDEFIGMASHELKTPVTSIKGYLQILQKSRTIEGTDKVFIGKALVQITKLSSLISDLLDVSKIEAGKLPLSFSRFDLYVLLREVIEIVNYETVNHTITAPDFAGELFVEADRHRIEQVLINLLSNAVKYSPNGGQVHVAASAENNEVTVSVRDSGIGIHQDHIERIFSRFYRVDDLAPHMSGLGIGLYISAEIIARHNGRLTAESDPGKGSVFYFTIPVSH